MIRISSGASVKDSEFAMINLMVMIAEKEFGTAAVKQELDRHKVLYFEVLDATNPRDS